MVPRRYKNPRRGTERSRDGTKILLGGLNGPATVGQSSLVPYINACPVGIAITVLENISWTYHKKGPECLGWVCLHSVPWVSLIFQQF